MKTERAALVAVRPADTVEQALDAMQTAGVGAVLVLGPDGKAQGILTERDVLRRWRDWRDPKILAQAIGEVATQPVRVLSVDQVNDAGRLMVEKHIRHVPLVGEKGEVLGVVSVRDLLKAGLAAGRLPELTPVRAEATTGAEHTLHILTPTAELAQICRKFLPAGWHPSVWMSLRSIENLPEMKAEAAGAAKIALMLDLDGVAKEDWKGLMRKLIKRLATVDRPTVFMVWSAYQFSEKDVEALTLIAERAKWYSYNRPLPVAALAHDLSTLQEKS